MRRSVAPALTLEQVAKFDPCSESFDRIKSILPSRRKITANQARAAGATFEDLIWVVFEAADRDKDVERRLRMWMADCAARVLHIYEKHGKSDGPRRAIIAARQYANGEISSLHLDAAKEAAWDACHDAFKTSVWAAAITAAGHSVWAVRVAACAAVDEAAEDNWQFDRLCTWLSESEPEPWPLPEQ